MAHPIRAAKDAFLGALAAAPELATVKITRGGPTENEDITENMIFLGDTTFADDWHMLGKQSRRVEFTLNFTIAVRTYGDDEAATEDQAWAFYDTVLTVLRADPKLGGTIRQFTRINGGQLNQPVAPSQWGAVIQAGVTCEAIT